MACFRYSLKGFNKEHRIDIPRFGVDIKFLVAAMSVPRPRVAKLFRRFSFRKRNLKHLVRTYQGNAIPSDRFESSGIAPMLNMDLRIFQLFRESA